MVNPGVLAQERLEQKVEVILAIDTSGSMLATDGSGITAIEAAKQAAIDFISMLSTEDQIAACISRHSL